jgi:hypothetical protein
VLLRFGAKLVTAAQVIPLLLAALASRSIHNRKNMTSHVNLISYLVIDRIITAAVTMGIANPLATTTDACIFDNLTATAAGQMLIQQDIHSGMSIQGSDARSQAAIDWIAGYQFTDESPLSRIVALESLGILGESYYALAERPLLTKQLKSATQVCCQNSALISVSRQQGEPNIAG